MKTIVGYDAEVWPQGLLTCSDEMAPHSGNKCETSGEKWKTREDKRGEVEDRLDHSETKRCLLWETSGRPVGDNLAQAAI